MVYYVPDGRDRQPNCPTPPTHPGRSPRMPALRRTLFALGAVATLCLVASADEQGDAVKKQKATAEEKVKASELKLAGAETT